MHFIPWIVFTLFYSLITYLPNTSPLRLLPSDFTWVADIETPVGSFLHWNNFVFSFICSALEMTFNILSLRWVHKTRKNIQSLPAPENRRREIMLLIQSTLIGSVFASSHIFYTIVMGSGINSAIADVAVHCVWMFNHCDNPLVYLAVNGKLRRAFLKFVSCGKLFNTASVSPNINQPAQNIVAQPAVMESLQ